MQQTASPSGEAVFFCPGGNRPLQEKINMCTLTVRLPVKLCATLK